MTAKVRPLYCALGDSTGVGVGARDGRGYVARLHERLEQREPSMRLLNLCVSGATSRGVLEWQLPRAVRAAPSFVTVFVGTNDLIQGVAPERFGEHIGRLARALRESGARSLFCTLPDLAHAPAARAFLPALGIERGLLEARTLALNARIVEQARAHGHAVQDLFDIALHDRAHYFCADGFHPSSEGYEELANQLWPPLARLQGEEPAAARA